MTDKVKGFPFDKPTSGDWLFYVGLVWATLASVAGGIATASLEAEYGGGTSATDILLAFPIVGSFVVLPVLLASLVRHAVRRARGTQV